MIDVFAARNASPLTTSPLASPQQPGGGKVLRMVQGSRTAGSMPVWSAATTPQNSVELSLSQAVPTHIDTRNNLSLQDDRGNGLKSESAPFGFADILDMINPLQHIPVVSHLYRSITGDAIRPSSQIVGGTIFGGPVGLASGIVNVIAEHETGRDITGNALRLITEGKAPEMIRKHSPDIQMAALEGEPGATREVQREGQPEGQRENAFEPAAGPQQEPLLESESIASNELLAFTESAPEPSESRTAFNQTAITNQVMDLPASLLAFSEPSYAVQTLRRPLV